MAQIVITDATGKVDRHPITKRETVIGRGPDCDIRIDHQAISRYHCIVRASYRLSDPGSTNGIWKGDEQVQDHALAPGETVALGKGRSFLLTIDDAVSPAPARPGGDTASEGFTVPGAPAPAPIEAPAPAPVEASSPPLPPADAPAPGRGAHADLERTTARLVEVQSTYQRLHAAYKKLVEENAFLRTALEQGPAAEEPEEFPDFSLSSIPAAPPEAPAPEAEASPAPSPEPSPEPSPRPSTAPAATSGPAPKPDPGSDPDLGSPGAVTPPSPPATSPSLSGPASAHDGPFLERILGLFAPDGGGVGLKVDAAQSTEAAAFLVETLWVMSQHVERVTTRFAQKYSGNDSPMTTYLPALSQNLRSLARDLVVEATPQARRRVDEYLRDLRLWLVASLLSHQTVLEPWLEDFLQQISPTRIRSDLKHQLRGMGKLMEADRLPTFRMRMWKRYEYIMANTTPAVLLQDLEERAAKAAQDFVNREDPDASRI